ncbi:hypothetical protein MANAM107_04550 [Actinomyces capricornis]|uniref:Uncharacterized protein n=1 Tax=Actinomyces capricornis TaxID=2755559 RepID=A0ABN6K3R4_9ACTO|nr:hypothetical protein MANAM107_04550 [Actinomyces capricornis]
MEGVASMTVSPWKWATVRGKTPSAWPDPMPSGTVVGTRVEAAPGAGAPEGPAVDGAPGPAEAPDEEGDDEEQAARAEAAALRLARDRAVRRL